MNEVIKVFPFIKKYIGFFLLFGGIFGIGTVNLIKADAKEDVSMITSIATYSVTTTSAKQTVEELALTQGTTNLVIFVDIKGAVCAEGVYSVSRGTRIFQALALAGGVLANADTSGINLALEVFDEMVIYIPEMTTKAVATTQSVKTICVQIRGEVVEPKVYYIPEASTLAALINLAGGLTNDADISGLDFSETLCSGYSILIPTYTAKSLIDDETEENHTSVDDGLIDINSAGLEVLMSLKGIGMVLGQRIIDYRAEYGGFSSIEDIMHVSGIKESIYENVREYIKVGDW